MLLNVWTNGENIEYYYRKIFNKQPLIRLSVKALYQNQKKEKLLHKRKKTIKHRLNFEANLIYRLSLYF